MEDFWTRGIKFLEKYPEYLEDFRNSIALKIYVSDDDDKIVQMVHTPKQLCKEITTKLKEHVDIRGKKILVLNVEFIPYLLDAEELVVLCDNDKKVEFVNRLYPDAAFPQIDVWEGCLLDYGELEMKFDVIVMNPPYQTNDDGKTHPLWEKFVEKSLLLTKDNGYICNVHPSGWRDAAGCFKKIQLELKSKKIEYLEIHDREDGVKTFGMQTAYDWYILQNCKGNGKTLVKDHSGKIQEVDLRNLDFIPNEQFELFSSVLAKTGEETCEVISNSSYHTQRIEWMNSVQEAEFKYPCVYTILKDGTINFYWSRINSNGHFGIPKVIWSNGTSATLVDLEGKYGLTQFAYAIIDEVNNLHNIKKAMDSEKFIKLMEVCQLIGKHRYHFKAISLFRKDFWKDFI